MAREVMSSLFNDLPTNLSEEFVTVLASKQHVRIERLVSTGNASPKGYWYDQKAHEWFSVHEETAEKCSCISCNGELTKPILKHDHPASIAPIPKQNVPFDRGLCNC